MVLLRPKAFLAVLNVAARARVIRVRLEGVPVNQVEIVAHITSVEGG